jgi:hypothetical protein
MLALVYHEYYYFFRPHEHNVVIIGFGRRRHSFNSGGHSGGSAEPDVRFRDAS